MTNEQLIANGPVRAYETSKDEATAAGAIAFFGDKYGDIVRVLEAGVSVELCGGTHVGALGDIGMVKVVTESSIGSNLRRIEAVTGANAVEYVLAHHRTLTAAASLLGAQPSELVSAIQRKIDENKALGEELRSLRAAQATSRASEMAASAQGGVVVSRVDGVTPNDLRELALAIRQNAAIKIVVLGGVTDTGGVALVATVSSDVSVAAGDLIRDAAKAVGGGGGGKGDIATAVARILRLSMPRSSLRAQLLQRCFPLSMRAVGIDLGSKRIGVSTSDASGTLASPHSVIQRGGARSADHDAIKLVVDEYEAEVVVVGLPVSMNGQMLQAAQLVLTEVDQISQVVGVPVVTFDERKSTVTADHLLMQNELNAQERRKIIDKVAAAVILQGWLDRRKEQMAQGQTQ